jgi:hypothetical protein
MLRITFPEIEVESTRWSGIRGISKEAFSAYPASLEEKLAELVERTKEGWEVVLTYGTGFEDLEMKRLVFADEEDCRDPQWYLYTYNYGLTQKSIEPFFEVKKTCYFKDDHTNRWLLVPKSREALVTWIVQEKLAFNDAFNASESKDRA